jgi:aminoglycoside 6'-N-acetyltransferase I
MQIREFNINDLDPCITLFMNVFCNEPWNDRWSAEQAKDYLYDFVQTPGFIGIVADDINEELIGLLLGSRKKWWSGDELFINEMCVDPNHQSLGVGSAMFRYLEDTLPGIGIESLVLLTDRGVPAEAFYHKNGFEEVSRIVFLAKHIK